jgi:hypothetical protein
MMFIVLHSETSGLNLTKLRVQLISGRNVDRNNRGARKWLLIPLSIIYVQQDKTGTRFEGRSTFLPPQTLKYYTYLGITSLILSWSASAQ